MKVKILITTIIIGMQFIGCSSRTMGSFEDLYSATEVRSATAKDYSDIKAAGNKPIIKETTQEKQQREYKSYDQVEEKSIVHTASGKIIDKSYDRDVKLFIYAFLEDTKSNPISFYSYKDLKQDGKIITVKIKDNFLIDTKAIIKTKSKKIKGIKRKRSRVKVPIVEKINTL